MFSRSLQFTIFTFNDERTPTPELELFPDYNPLWKNDLSDNWIINGSHERTEQHTGMAGRIRKGAVCCWREGYGSDGFKVTCLFYSSFPASFSSSLLELVWRVSFYPFCLGLYLPWPKAITLNPQVNPNRDQLTRELLPPNNNPAAFKWWSGLV